jgi:ABC-type glutathione transport system ATPase component
MKTFAIADKLELPLDAVTERLGWLGQSGSGKTYGAMRLAELMLEAGAQIVALDPVGVWKGLRTSADGKAPGFAVALVALAVVRWRHL